LPAVCLAGLPFDGAQAIGSEAQARRGHEPVEWLCRYAPRNDGQLICAAGGARQHGKVDEASRLAKRRRPGGSLEGGSPSWRACPPRVWRDSFGTRPHVRYGKQCATAARAPHFFSSHIDSIRPTESSASHSLSTARRRQDSAQWNVVQNRRGVPPLHDEARRLVYVGTRKIALRRCSGP